MFRTILCGSMCIAAFAALAGANVNIVSQQRYVRSHSWGHSTLPTLTVYDDDKQQAASDLTAFNQTVNTSVTAGGSLANGFASQNSTLTQFVLDVSGGARHFEINGMGGDAFGESTSVFEVVFDIFYPQNATVTGNITRGSAPGSTSLSLTGPSGPISLPLTGPFNNLNLNTTIPLTVGQYTMRASTLAAPNWTEQGDERWDSYSMKLSVPVPEPAGLSLAALALTPLVRRLRRVQRG